MKILSILFFVVLLSGCGLKTLERAQPLLTAEEITTLINTPKLNEKDFLMICDKINDFERNSFNIEGFNKFEIIQEAMRLREYLKSIAIQSSDIEDFMC